MNEPIRILNMFTVMDRGGAETMVMNYYRNIDRNKVQFDFLVHRTRRGIYDDEIEALGGRIFRMCPIYPQNFSKYKKRLNSFFKDHTEYRIIHSHMSELGYFAFKEATRREVPVRICHAHNNPRGFDAKMIVRTYFKHRMIPYITDMFVCGREAGEWLFGKENKSRFIMMNNAIDSKEYAYNQIVRLKMRNQLGLTNSLVIGHVGRFHTQKNHDFLIDIFYELYKIQPNAKLMLVGDGAGRAEIERKVEQLGLMDSVIFMGVRSDVNDLLQAMDVFVFPSLYEGLGNVVVEAQAAGLPCVISDYVPEECIVTSGLVTVQKLSDSAEKWARHILTLTGKERSNRSGEIKASGFDIVENAKWLEEFYLERSK